MKLKPIPVLLLIIFIAVNTFPINAQLPLSYKWVRSTTVYAPAVAGSEYAPGVLIKVDVAVAYPGTGKVFFQAQPLTQLDTQATARVAALVASSLAGVDFFRYDYYILMSSKSMVVGGPSAGAIMTIAILSILTNKTLKPDVTMTGMVNPDGTIGPVGGLKSKLEAAAREGYKVFLIPFGQRIVMVPNVTIIHYPWGYEKKITYEKVDLVQYGESLGVDVVEVASIRDAYTYFTGYNLTTTTAPAEPILPKPFTVILENNTNQFIEEASMLINSTEHDLDKVNPFYRRSIKTLLSKAEDEIERTRGYLESDELVLAVNTGFKAAYIASYAYWLLQVMIDSSNLDKLLDNVNKTIASASSKLETLEEKPLTTGLYDIIVAGESRLSDSIQYYERAMDEIKANDLGGAISDLVYSLWRAKSVETWLKVADTLGNGEQISLNRVYETTITLYGIAESIVSYAYTLAKDLGTTPNELENALNQIDLAGKYIAENNTFRAIGNIADAMTNAIISIHILFVDSNTVRQELCRKIEYETLLDLGRLSVNNTVPVLPMYYIVYGRELYDNQQYLNALISYILASIHTKIIEYSLGKTIVKPQIEPAVNPGGAGTTTTTPIATTTVTVTTGISSQMPSYIDYKSILVGLMPGILVGIAIGFLLNKKKTIAGAYPPS